MSLKLYSSYGCPRCSYIKKVLDKIGVEYEELDIDKEPKYREQLGEKIENPNRIPVLEKDGEIIHIGTATEEELREKLED